MFPALLSLGHVDSAIAFCVSDQPRYERNSEGMLSRVPPRYICGAFECRRAALHLAASQPRAERLARTDLPDRANATSRSHMSLNTGLLFSCDQFWGEMTMHLSTYLFSTVEISLSSQPAICLRPHTVLLHHLHLSCAAIVPDKASLGTNTVRISECRYYQHAVSGILVEGCTSRISSISTLSPRFVARRSVHYLIIPTNNHR